MTSEKLFIERKVDYNQFEYYNSIQRPSSKQKFCSVLIKTVYRIDT